MAGSPPTLASRLDKQVKQIAGRVAELERDNMALVEELTCLYAHVNTQVEELNLRCLFTMMMLKVTRATPTGLRDANDKPITEEQTKTLYARYGEERVAFRERMMAYAEQAEREGSPLEGPGQGSTAGDLHDHEPAEGNGQGGFRAPGEGREATRP